MQTLLFMFEANTGAEHEIRAINRAFPAAAFASVAGVEQVAIFLGSGLFALEATFSGDEIQFAIREFIDHPRIQEYFGRLREHVPGLPLAWAETGSMPVAAPALVWSARGEPTAIAI